MSPNLSWTQSLSDKQWKTNSVFRLKLQTASVKIVQFYVHCQNYFWQPQNPLDTMITSPSWRLTEAKGNMSKFSPCLDFHDCDLLFLNKTGSLKCDSDFFLPSFENLDILYLSKTPYEVRPTAIQYELRVPVWKFAGAGGEHSLTHSLGWDLVTAKATAYDSHSLTSHLLGPVKMGIDTLEKPNPIIIISNICCLNCVIFCIIFYKLILCLMF